MADNARQQIREAVALALSTLTTVPAANVKTSQVYTFDTVPSICVRTPSGAINRSGDRIGDYVRRQVRVVIEIRVKPTESDAVTWEEQLDAISAEIEQHLAADHTLGGLCGWFAFFDWEIEGSKELERQAGLEKMGWVASINTLESDPTVVLS